MKKFLIIGFCIQFLAADAQQRHLPRPFDFIIDTTKPPFISFVGDTTTGSAHGLRYDSALDLQYELRKDYTFELRLKQYHLESNVDNVFVLTLRQGKWRARYFDRNNGIHESTVFTERTVDQSAVSHLWSLLVDNKILTLPSQNSLTNRLVSYEIDTANLPYVQNRCFDVTDGVAYEFSLQSPTRQRHYSYCCPQTFLKQFGNVKELFHAVMLIMLIKKFLGQPLEVR